MSKSNPFKGNFIITMKNGDVFEADGLNPSTEGIEIKKGEITLETFPIEEIREIENKDRPVKKTLNYAIVPRRGSETERQRYSSYHYSDKNALHQKEIKNFIRGRRINIREVNELEKRSNNTKILESCRILSLINKAQSENNFKYINGKEDIIDNLLKKRNRYFLNKHLKRIDRVPNIDF